VFKHFEDSLHALKVSVQGLETFTFRWEI